MSVLTKVLIILLTLFTIFLCGIVVTYVASANNYKAAYENLFATKDALQENNSSLKQRQNEQAAGFRRLIDELKTNVMDLEISKEQLEVELASKQRNLAVLQQRVNSWAGIVKGFEQTISGNEESLKDARMEVDNLQEQQIEDKKKLNEVTASLNEKMVELEALEAERRQLLEKNRQLENQVAKLDKQSGIAIEVTEPVTQLKEKAKAAHRITKQAELNGLVTEVDLKNSLATISIGSADGVMTGATFYVTRGDTFICNILITDVEPEVSAGVMELVVQPPQVGDKASTSL